MSAKNLFDDLKIRTMLDCTRHTFLQNLITTKYGAIKELGDTFGLGQSMMPSLKAVTADKEATGEKGDKQIAAAGMIRLNLANSVNEDKNELLSDDMLELLRKDLGDF